MHVLEAEGTKVAALYDTVTHGAPAAHALGFKHGGLRSILQKDRGHFMWPKIDSEVRDLGQRVDTIGGLIDALALRFSDSSSKDGGPSVAKSENTQVADVGQQSIASPENENIVASSNGEKDDSVNSVDDSTVVLRRVRSSTDFFGRSDLGILEQTLQEAKSVANLVRSDTIAPPLARTLRIRQSGKSESSQPHEAATAGEAVSAPRASIAGVRPPKPRTGAAIGQAIDVAIATVNTMKTNENAGRMIMALRELKHEVDYALYEVDTALLLEAISNDHSDHVVHRRDVTFSHACTCLVTSFVATLVNRRKDALFLKQLYSIGFLAQFESLLSTQGKETGMIEDMAVAVADLSGVSFRLVLAPDGVEPFSRLDVQGRRYKICITLEVPTSLYDRLPEDIIRTGSGLISVYPVFMSHGVNEMQTIANKLGETDLQDDIVAKGVEGMAQYVSSSCYHQNIFLFVSHLSLIHI